MNRITIIYWQEKKFWIGYVQEYPQYQTQGRDVEELKENLKDIYLDIRNGLVPDAQKAQVSKMVSANPSRATAKSVTL